VAKKEPKEREDAYEAIFTALAHPVRRRILITVYFHGGSMTAGQIAKLFEHAWPTTTRHLQALEAAGLLQHKRNGRTRHYRINCRRLELVRDWLNWFSRAPGKTKGGRHGNTKES
jgi:DNA-binding transcriptional ArsR family regulator